MVSVQGALLGFEIVILTLMALTVLAVILRAVSRFRQRMSQPADAATGRRPPERTRFPPDRIVPILRDAAWPTQVRSAAAERGIAAGNEEVYGEPLNEHLAVFYAYDHDAFIHHLYRDQIEAAGIPIAGLRARSVRNLLAMLPPIEVLAHDGVYQVVAGTCYEACLLLDDSFWTPERFPIDGDIVVAIPRQEVLVVTGSRNPDGLARIRGLVADVEQEFGDILTPHLLVRRDGRWQIFE